MAETSEKLFAEFPPISAQAWVDKIKVDLKDTPYDKKMIWKTGEGFNVNPFYSAEDIENSGTTKSLPGEFPYIRGTKICNNWLVRQDIDVTDFKAANEKAQKLLAESGITSLGFHFKGDFVTRENLNALLEGICPEKAELNFKTCNHKVLELIEIITEIFKAKGVELDKCKGSVSYNPFKKPLIKGQYIGNEWIKESIDIINASEALSEYSVVAVDACYLNDAGAYITQELGYALSNGNDILAKLSEAGLPVNKIAPKIKFNFGISSNYFMEIAKFRAARWLWAEIVKAYNPEGDFCSCACKIKIHARTSKWNMTIYDTNVNMLRSQTETMSAALAGVDSITVIPFDDAFKKPDDFSERIARNQQLLLKEECHFDKIVDASGGSYYIEMLTDSIAQEAWKLFLETEEKGFYESVISGEIQNAINASADKRFKFIAQRREILLGTNQFPNFTETVSGKVEAGGKQKVICRCSDNGVSDIPVLNTRRLGENFETLRLTTENSGREVKAFMLTIGNLAMRLARSQFSSNFLACAGYKVIDNLGFETVAQGVKAARKADADIIVLCSSDDEYAVYAPEAYQLINASAEGKKGIFIVAGAPACMEDLRAQGITDYINVKSNVLETLQELNNKLGIG
jgi:methylmalonyl-CoA mutase